MQGIIRLVKLVRATPAERHCEIELCLAPQSPGQEVLYLVNLREGQPDAEWQESSKTPLAVSLDKAEVIFTALVNSKLEQGFAEPPALPDGTSTITGHDALQWGHTSQTLVQKISKPKSVQEQENILLQRLQPRAWSGLARIERSRTVWRIGERRLQAAVPRLVELIATGDEMLDYCIAYAIGRCGDTGAAQAMHELSQRADLTHVRLFARQAWLALCSHDKRQQLAQDLIDSWPGELQNAWREAHRCQSIDPIQLSLLSTRNWPGWRYDDWLEQVDCVALADISYLARPLLLQLLKTLPVSLMVYRAFRHLYKVAEFRCDAEMFGILHQRFEKAWPLFFLNAAHDRIYLERRYVKYADEVRKPDTRVAYSTLTRDYLRRRTWRTLRRLGAIASPDFVTMATGVLLACDDAHADKAYVQRLLHWNRQSRSYDTELRYHSPYAGWMVFNQIVHQHDSPFKTSRTARKWWQPVSTQTLEYPARSTRQEAFPQLWDAAPDRLLQLLQHSLCMGVHVFAARALADNQDYCQQLSLEQLQTLLQSVYLPTRELAFNIVRQRFSQQTPDLNWLTILLAVDFVPAAEFALGFIRKKPELYAQEASLMLAMIASPLAQVRDACRLLAQAAAAETRKSLLGHLLNWVRSAAIAQNQFELLRGDLLWLLQTLLAEHVAQLSDTDLFAWCELLLAEQFWQQELATEILLAHPAGIAHVSPETLRGLLQSADPGRQSLGSRLFAALPASILQEQPDLVASLASADDARIRAAMTPVILQLGAHTVFAASLLAHLMDVMFRSDASDTGDGENSVHADIIQWCSGPLLTATLALPVDLQWRLLQARSKGAQQLGAMLLAQSQGPLAAGLTVLQWALLGKHAILQVRLQAQAYFREHLAEIRQHFNDALRILDTPWAETRVFAADYFAGNIQSNEWSLSQLLALCDHSQAAVQRLGRQLITRRFRVEEATDYVLHLSQHPSASMQLFVSQWLEQSVGSAVDQPQALQQLQQLRPYFLSVLSHVNKARTVKNRVIRFLQDQGLLSESHAHIVAEIFTRQVLTVAIQDKAQYILGLSQLLTKYPALAQTPGWPVQTLEQRTYAAQGVPLTKMEPV